MSDSMCAPRSGGLVTILGRPRAGLRAGPGGARSQAAVLGCCRGPAVEPSLSGKAAFGGTGLGYKSGFIHSFIHSFIL